MHNYVLRSSDLNLKDIYFILFFYLTRNSEVEGPILICNSKGHARPRVLFPHGGKRAAKALWVLFSPSCI